MNRILVAEDDESLLEAITAGLRHKYQVIPAKNGKTAMQLTSQELPDLVILDIHLPDMTGLDICERLRSNPVTREISILLMTGDPDPEPRLSGLYLGADDSIAKPFTIRELRARVHARLRRREIDRASNKRFRLANLEIDPVEGEVYIDGESLNVTQFELKMITYLIERPNALIRRADLLRDLWPDAVVNRRTIDTHIVHIRRKLADFDGKLETVYGGGYRLRVKQAEGVVEPATDPASGTDPV